MPKTGTTSIQDLLAANSADLERDGVLFPIVRQDLRDAGRAQGVGIGWHRALATFVAGAAALKPGEWATWRAEFARFRTSEALHTLALSQEGLLDSGHRQRTEALLATIPQGATRIVVVMRPAAPWLTSLYEQRVRSIARTAERPGDFRDALNYAERGFQGIIRRIETLAPGASLLVLGFDDLVAGDGLLANFVRATGLPDWLVARAAAVPQTNSGLPQDMVAFLRTANALNVPHADFVAIRGALARAARRRTTPKIRAQIFPDALAARIADRYERDRAFLKRRFGLILASGGTPAPEQPLAFDATALRLACAPFLAGDALAAFDRVAAADG